MSAFCRECGAVRWRCAHTPRSRISLNLRIKSRKTDCWLVTRAWGDVRLCVPCLCGASCVVSSWEIVRAAVRRVGESCSCSTGSGREEKTACARSCSTCRWSASLLPTLVSQPPERYRRLSIGIVVELWGWWAWCSEEGFRVVHGGMLGFCSPLHGSMQ
jgi:hypothetical protein